jgi:ADP-heptose:LPS heptosyltransferase
MKLNCSEIKRILIIQFRPFGDVLLATSYLGALRESFPRVDIDFLVKEPYLEVLDKNPYLSNVIFLPQEKGISYILGRVKLIFEIRKRKYDLIIDQQNGVGSGQVLLFSGAK